MSTVSQLDRLDVLFALVSKNSSTMVDFFPGRWTAFVHTLSSVFTCTRSIRVVRSMSRLKVQRGGIEQFYRPKYPLGSITRTGKR